VDRVGLLYTLATMPAHPESVPINALVPIAGTPLGTADAADSNNDQVLATQQRKGEIPTAIDMTRMIATARCIMPRTMLRLSAGRMSYTEAEQGLMMLAGEISPSP
jgi:biotin synthase